jgi:hypothetical protein
VMMMCFPLNRVSCSGGIDIFVNVCIVLIVGWLVGSVNVIVVVCVDI